MIYFASGELSGFAVTDLVGVLETTTASRYDGTYARSAMTVNNATSWITAQLRDEITGAVVSPTSIWVHMEMYQEGTGAFGNRVMSFFNSTGVEVFRIVSGTSTNTSFRLQYRNSAGTLTSVAAVDTATIPGSTKSAIDIFVDCAGTMQMYLANNLQVASSGTFTSTQTNNISTVRLSCSNSGSTYSQVIVADQTTVGWKLKTMNMTAVGTHTAATGTVTDINEATTVNDLTLITFANAGDKESYVAADVTIPLNFECKGVAVTARAKIGVSGPQNLQPIMNISGVDYTHPVAFGGYTSGGFTGSHLIVTNDPSTGLPWGATNLAATELGLAAAA